MSRIPQSLRRPWFGVALCGIVLATVSAIGCHDAPTAPPARAVQFVPSFFGPDPMTLDWVNDHVLVVIAYESNPAFRLAEGEYSLLTVTTPDGDREEMHLTMALCDDDSGNPYKCDEFWVQVPHDHHAAELRPRIEALGGRLRIQQGRTDGGAVRAVDGDLDTIRRQVSRWPEVAHVLTIYAIAGTPYIVVGPRQMVEGALPVEVAAPTPGDGRLQVPLQGKVTLTYRLPNGSDLANEVLIPPSS